MNLSDAVPEAVLWDMDGTLVDTEPYWIAAEYDLAAAHGGHWSDEHAEALVGNDLVTSAEYIRQHAGIDLTPAEIIDGLLDGVVARVRTHIPWRPGARDLLAALAEAHVPCALVTMSYHRFADAVVSALPEGSFATVVAGDDVRHGKPHPEPYLTAASRLRADPSRCLAVEDSPTGLASAVAAGIPVLAVENVIPLAPGPDRHLVTTLKGLTPADLGAIASALRAAG